MSDARATALPGAWRRLAAFDLALLLLVQRPESAALTRLMRGLTHLGDTPSWLLLAAALGASSGDGARQSALAGFAALVALAVSQPLKRLCARPRPRFAAAAVDGGERAGRLAVVAHEDDPDAFSFPSGHTAVAFAVAAALAGEGSALGELTLGLAAGIGVSRVYLGAHYPLDVAAGALLGSGCGWLARLVLTHPDLARPLLAALGAGLPPLS